MIYTCDSCFAPLNNFNGTDEFCFCEHCGNKNKPIKESVNDVANLNQTALKNCGRFYQQAILTHTGDTQQMEGSLAFVFLKMKLYEKAQEHFSKAIDDFCSNSELYYGWSIAILNGKGAYGNFRETIDEANRYLDAALSLENKGIYYYMKAFIAFDYFYAKHFRISPNYVDYLKKATEAGITKEEMNTMYELLGVNCPKELYLSL